jgi:hypothetical protein
VTQINEFVHFIHSFFAVLFFFLQGLPKLRKAVNDPNFKAVVELFHPESKETEDTLFEVTSLIKKIRQDLPIQLGVEVYG